LILTFDLGVKVIKKKNSPTLFICIYGPNLDKIGLVISEKIEFPYPPKRRTTTTISEL